MSSFPKALLGAFSLVYLALCGDSSPKILELPSDPKAPGPSSRAGGEDRKDDKKVEKESRVEESKKIEAKEEEKEARDPTRVGEEEKKSNSRSPPLPPLPERN